MIGGPRPEPTTKRPDLRLVPMEKHFREMSPWAKLLLFDLLLLTDTDLGMQGLGIGESLMVVARYRVRRDQERELRYALHDIRKAIDDYKDATASQKIAVKLGSDGYPESLQQLVEGVKLLQSPDGKKIKFLRRIPLDPMTNTREWGLRSTQDDPKSQSWGGQNVFSVYTKSFARAADGTPYSEW